MNKQLNLGERNCLGGTYLGVSNLSAVYMSNRGAVPPDSVGSYKQPLPTSLINIIAETKLVVTELLRAASTERRQHSLRLYLTLLLLCKLEQ